MFPERAFHSLEMLHGILRKVTAGEFQVDMDDAQELPRLVMQGNGYFPGHILELVVQAFIQQAKGGIELLEAAMSQFERRQAFHKEGLGASNVVQSALLRKLSGEDFREDPVLQRDHFNDAHPVVESLAAQHIGTLQ